MTIASFIQGQKMGARVFLYHLALDMFGEEDVFFAPGTYKGAPVSFGDQVYSPHPVIAEGFELTSTGQLPSPSFAIGNIDGLFNALVEENDDLIGARFTRIRTYERFLDGGEEPNGDAQLPPDIYELSKKTRHDDEAIQWRLSALIDQEGVELPARQVVRDYCDHLVRIWNPATASFDYTLATCPYVGAPKDESGEPCAPEDEVFSKRLGTCCQARFGATAALPTRAFPGVARIRTR